VSERRPGVSRFERFFRFIKRDVSDDIGSGRERWRRLSQPEYGESLWWAYGLVEFVAGAEVLLVVALLTLGGSLSPAAERTVDRSMESWGAGAVLMVLVGFGWASVAAFRALFEIESYQLVDTPMRRPRWTIALVLLLVAFGVVVWWFAIPESAPPGPLDTVAPLALALIPCLPLFGYTGHARFLLPGVWLLVGLAPLPLLSEAAAGVWPWVAIIGGLVGQGIWAGWSLKRRAARPASLDTIKAMLSSSEAYQRAAAAAYIGYVGEPRALPQVARLALRDPNARIRQTAGDALIAVWGPSVDALQDLWVEETGFTRLRPGELSPELLADVNEDLESIRVNVSNYEGAVEQSVRNALDDDPDLMDVLVELATRAPRASSVSSAAAGGMWLLAASCDARAKDVLVGLVTEGSERVSVEASQALGIYGPDVLGDLAVLLRAEDSDLRRRAARAVLAVLETQGDRGEPVNGQIASDLAGELLGASRDSEPRVRREAVMAMGHLRESGQRDALAARAREMLSDSAAGVRVDALKAVVLLDIEGCVEDVRAALADRAASVRTVAVEAVGVLRETPLLPAVEKIAATDPSEQTSAAEWRLLETADEVLAASQYWDAVPARREL
jgi:HEAT repeat protein